MKCSAIAALVSISALLAGCSSVELPAWNPEAQGVNASTGTGAQSGASTRVQRVLPPDNQAPASNWREYRQRAADRINRANPNLLYAGSLPSVFQAIPVLRVELTEDGSVRRIDVAREPTQSPETVQIAIDAIYRAAPFGPTRQLSAPVEFTETFLFNQDLKFRLRTTVEGQ